MDSKRNPDRGGVAAGARSNKCTKFATNKRTTAAIQAPSASDLSCELSLCADYVARLLLGEPNRKATGRSRTELRYGNFGSLRVRIAGPKRGRWNDFEKGERGDLLDLIRREQGCSLPEACDYASDLLGLAREEGEGTIVRSSREARPKLQPEPENDAGRTRYTLHIFNEAVPIMGTPGEVYFARRGIDLNAVPDLHGVLRWHPRCPWGEGAARHPCIVALWTDIISVEPKAIHRRPISAEGEKVDRWKALGPSLDCCIRLWPDDYVEQGLVLGEGPETVLAAATRVAHRGTLLQPAWCAGDAGHLRCFPVLPGIDALSLLVDHDANSAGQDAAAECKQRWIAAGRDVIRLTPRIVETDFADIIAGEIAP
jgi:putative DNA primase/helicase